MINDIDIILLNKKNIIHYKAYKSKNNISNLKYEYDIIMILKSKGQLDYFFITKDNKYLILIHYHKNFKHNIDFYLTKTFKKVAGYSNILTDRYYECKKCYLINEHCLSLQYTHTPRTILEPPDIMHIIDFQDINT